MPVGRIGRERRETGEAAFARIADLAHYFLPRQEAHQIDIAAGKGGDCRERNDVYVGLLGNRLYRLNLGGEQWPQYQPCSVADDRACGAGGAGRIPAGVARHQDQAVAAALEECQLRRVEEGLTEFGIGAR